VNRSLVEDSTLGERTRKVGPGHDRWKRREAERLTVLIVPDQLH
jgi:hypothetical protein